MAEGEVLKRPLSCTAISLDLDLDLDLDLPHLQQRRLPVRRLAVGELGEVLEAESHGGPETTEQNRNSVAQEGRSVTQMTVSGVRTGAINPSQSRRQNLSFLIRRKGNISKGVMTA